MDYYKESSQLAGKHYDPSMRTKENKNQFQKGLSVTHEQISDNYMEGTVDQYVVEQNDNM
ncbi:YozQ family protein [Bacillus andreraoultii]|uniref:YozQ family protein n=1 Tax=Bacillus andreraoultii TaxID=1499685 RepID=UPI00053B1862|nr:YozQ family protein [Bacillus andreraoultii]